MRYFATLRSPAATCTLPAGIAAVLLLGGAALLSGCASSGGGAAGAASPGAYAEVAPMSARALSEALRAAERSWDGTPYRMGGTTRRGVDCSGFVQRLYHDALDAPLSRSTRTQVHEGRRVSKADLRPGDLVFFHPGYKTRHVGVYVGDGEFAHASSSQGVTITPLARAYWQDAYWTARRVLPVPAVASSSSTASRHSAGARAGW